MSNLDASMKKEQRPLEESAESIRWTDAMIYHRQLPLLEEAKKAQANCPHPHLSKLTHSVLCSECGALWTR